MSASMLDQLLAEAEEAENGDEEVQRQAEELLAKWFAVSRIYQGHSKELTRIVQPLEDLLPNVADYEAFAAPHDGKIAGPQWNTERFYTKAAKQLRVKNPGLVILTQCNRSKAEKGEVLQELSDEEYYAYLDDVELMADWWEKRPSATPLELAKSVIVHVVLTSPELHDLVLREAKAAVDHLVQLDARLAFWRGE